MRTTIPAYQDSLLDTLLDNIDGMVYRCLNDADWTMIYVNKGCEALTGYSSKLLLNNHALSYDSLIYESDKNDIRCKVNQAITQHKRFQFEYRITRADGKLIWVSEQGSVIFNAQNELIALEGLIVDINQRKQMEQDLFSTEQKYRSMFENSTLGMFQTTTSGKYLNANQALAKLYGYPAPAALINTLNNISQQLYIHEQRRTDFIDAVSQDGRIQNFESEVYTYHNKRIWISENAHAVYDNLGDILYYEGTVEDITERKTNEQRIRHQAVTDNLTGLLNRHAYSVKLSAMIAEADRANHKTAIAFIDLDQFKLINDTLGHRAGDNLLKEIAQRLMECTRPSDAIVRFGGDEFLMLYPGLQSITDVEPLLLRVMKSISQPIQINDYEFNMTCSIGVSVYPDHAQEVDALLSCADAALHTAKNAGKNKVHMFTAQLARQLSDRNAIEYGLGHALQKQEFMLYYQPKLDFSNGQICGLEALIRWQHPERGLVPPDQFIAIAEETGHIFAMGEWVLQTACKQIKTIQKQFGILIPIAINVSPIQFLRANLVETVRKVLFDEGVSPHLITLEVTENACFKDEAMFTRTLQQLKQLGVSIAIDDFGLGYSNMAYLKNYPIDEIKIDKAFVSDLEQNTSDASILLALVNLGKSLHKSVTAEGVENAYQHAFLQESGCNVGQGYFYSKPLSSEALHQLLSEPEAAQNKLSSLKLLNHSA